MLKQTSYKHEKQGWLNDAAERIWQMATVKYGERLVDGAPEIPFLISMPNLINGYNRNPAHFAPADNIIVAHMAFSRSINRDVYWMSMIVHELTHWLQYRLVSHNPSFKGNTHIHTSWSEACSIVAESFGISKPLDYYRPLMSKRVDGVMRKVEREGSLTVKELHRFPDSVPGLIEAISNQDKTTNVNGVKCYSDDAIAKEVGISVETLHEHLDAGNSMRAILQLEGKAKTKEPMPNRATKAGKGAVQMSGWVWPSKSAICAYYNHGVQVSGASLSDKAEQAEKDGWAFALMVEITQARHYRNLGDDNRYSPEVEAMLPPGCLPIDQERLPSLGGWDTDLTPDFGGTTFA